MLQQIALIFRVVLGLLFAVTGLLKLPDLKGFYVVLVSYNLFPSWFARVNAYVLPVVEVLAGVWLLTGFYLRYSTLFSVLLLFSSTLIVLIVLLKGRKVENCGCYGTMFKTPISWKKFAENVLWLGMSIVAFFASF